jgi:hypothetical protein
VEYERRIVLWTATLRSIDNTSGGQERTLLCFSNPNSLPVEDHLSRHAVVPRHLRAGTPGSAGSATIASLWYCRRGVFLVLAEASCMAVLNGQSYLNSYLSFGSAAVPAR